MNHPFRKFFLCGAIFLTLLLSRNTFANDLQDVINAGVLNFGTATEYRPFVYYGNDYQMTGLDIELAKAIAEKMNIPVKIYDMAFDGLIDSVNYSQIDLIIGGFSHTVERESQVEFSQSYYESVGVIAASVKGSIPAQTNLNDLSSAKIGVQRGSCFDQWVKTNLIGAGLVSTQNVYTFNTIDMAMKALDSGTLDVVILDYDSFQQGFAATGTFRIVNDNIASEAYAIAAAKGSTELIQAVNSALDALRADGTLEKIIKKYTEGVFEDEAEYTITRPSQSELIVVPETAAPAIQPTAVPVAPQQPFDCKNVMVFMADVSIPDGTSVNPGAEFTKVWQLYNNGSCKWYEGYQVVYVDGDYMGGDSAVIPQETIPGRTVDVGIKLRAPEVEGQYVGYYQLRSPDGQYFGPKLMIKLNVRAGSPEAQIVGAPPVITVWQPDYYKGKNNFCPTVSWNVRNSTDIDLLINNKLWYHTNAPSGKLMMCPGGGKGDYSYGIVARGSKKVSFAFTYTNQGGKKAQPTWRPTPLPY